MHFNRSSSSRLHRLLRTVGLPRAQGEAGAERAGRVVSRETSLSPRCGGGSRPLAAAAVFNRARPLRHDTQARAVAWINVKCFDLPPGSDETKLPRVPAKTRWVNPTSLASQPAREKI